MQYRPVIVRMHKAKVMMTMLNTLNSGKKKTILKTRKPLSPLQWNQSNLSDYHTHQTLCSRPRHAAPKLPSHSDGGCRPSWLAAVGLHSSYCHWLPKTWTKGWASSLPSLVSIETLVMWLKQLDSVAVETPPSLSPLSSSWTPPFFPLSASSLVYCSLFSSAIGRMLRGGGEMLGLLYCLEQVLSGDPKTRVFAGFQLAQTTTEKCLKGNKKEFKGRFNVVLENKLFPYQFILKSNAKIVLLGVCNALLPSVLTMSDNPVSDCLAVIVI